MSKCCRTCIWYKHTINAVGNSLAPEASYCLFNKRAKRGNEGKYCKHYGEYTPEKAWNLNLK